MMPIHLTPPDYNPGGPDGRGWNRLSLNAHMGSEANQCALKPRSYATLQESQDTRRARWGGFGSCSRGGNCKGCPVYESKGRTLESFVPRVLVRLLDRTPEPSHPLATVQPFLEPHVMNRPEGGWGSYSEPWKWRDLARLEGWKLDGRFADKHGEGFWLKATLAGGGTFGKGEPDAERIDRAVAEYMADIGL